MAQLIVIPYSSMMEEKSEKGDKAERRKKEKKKQRPKLSSNILFSGKLYQTIRRNANVKSVEKFKAEVLASGD